MAPKQRSGKEVATSKAAIAAPPAIERPIAGKALVFLEISDLFCEPILANLPVILRKFTKN